MIAHGFTVLCHVTWPVWFASLYNVGVATKDKTTVKTKAFTTVSGVPINRLYTPEDIRDLSVEKDLGNPGEPPYTRGACRSARA